MSDSSAPLVVGVAGLRRQGRQLLESWLVRPEIRIAGVYDADPELRDRLRDLVPVCSTWAELLSRPELELVLLDTQHSDRQPQVGEALAAGKHVAITPPLARTVVEAQALLAAASRAGRTLFTVHSGWDDDTLRAADAVRSGAVGVVQLVSLCLWQFFPRPSASGGTGDVLWEHGPVYVDQLLSLVAAAPRGVTCRFLRTAPGETESGFLLLIDFAGGVQAQLQIHRGAFPPVDTGWTITGTQGGYSRGSVFRRLADDEIADEPLPDPKPEPPSLLTEIVEQVRQARPLVAALERDLCVITLLEAAQRSAISGERVSVAPPR